MTTVTDTQRTRCPKAICGHRYPCPALDFFVCDLYVSRAAPPEETGGECIFYGDIWNHTKALPDTFEVSNKSQRPGLRPQRLGLRPQSLNLGLQKAGLGPQMAGLGSQGAGLGHQGVGLGPQRVGLRPQMPDLRPQRAGLRP